MRSTRRALVLALLATAAATAACAASGGGTAGAPQRNRETITREEIQEARASNPFDLVQALRPQWLRARGGSRTLSPDPNAAPGQTTARPSTRGTGSVRTSAGEAVMGEGAVVVYLDQVRLGGPETLRQVPITTVTSIRYLDAAAATQRWGTGHPYGAIMVTTQGTP